jgi:hypothetical protein
MVLADKMTGVCMNTPGVIELVIALEAVVLLVVLEGLLATRARKSGRKLRRLRALWAEQLPLALSGQSDATDCIRDTLHTAVVWKAFHRYTIEEVGGKRFNTGPELRSVCRAVGLTRWLGRELREARNPLDRVIAARTLARLEESVSLDTVTGLLRSNKPVLVLAAAYAAAASKDPDQFLPVFRAIRDQTAITPHGAAELLSAFDKSICPVVHGLLAQAVPDPSASLRQHGLARNNQGDTETGCGSALVVMIELLTFHNHRAAAPTFVQLLELSDDEEVIEHLVKAITVLGVTDAAPRLIELLRYPNSVIRGKAAQALARLRAVEAVWDVRELLFDQNPTVRAEAKEALRLLERVCVTPRVPERVNWP